MLETMPKDPILEAIFDIRFSCPNKAISSIILGTFSVKEFKVRFPTVERLAINDLPIALRQSDPQLKFQPEYRLVGKNETLLIGSHNIAIALQKPYPGWTIFKAKILEILRTIENIGEELKPHRAAFRYINLIEPINPTGSHFEPIQFNGILGSFDLTQQKTLIKLEVNQDNFNHTIHVSNQASAQSSIDKSIATGLLLDIDTSINSGLDNFWSNKEYLIEQLRSQERIIFESIITPKTIERYRSNV